MFWTFKVGAIFIVVEVVFNCPQKLRDFNSPHQGKHWYRNPCHARWPQELWTLHRHSTPSTYCCYLYSLHAHVGKCINCILALAAVIHLKRCFFPISIITSIIVGIGSHVHHISCLYIPFFKLVSYPQKWKIRAFLNMKIFRSIFSALPDFVFLDIKFWEGM